MEEVARKAENKMKRVLKECIMTSIYVWLAEFGFAWVGNERRRFVKGFLLHWKTNALTVAAEAINVPV